MACRSLSLFLLAIFLPVVSQEPGGGKKEPRPFFDPFEFGARGDGKTLDTKALQAAVDACAEAGGGKVLLHGGTFLSGTIRLASGVNLHIAPGAVLLGSRDLKDYPVNIPAYRSFTDGYTDKSLVYAEGARNVSITGRGRIDGQGKFFKGPFKKRPFLLRFVRCEDVALRDIHLENAAMWVQHYLACDGVLLDGITVRSSVNWNNDGIDIDGSSRVRVSNCIVSSGDDALVLKSTSPRPCRFVTVTNCVLRSGCNALKLGTESNGGFQDITVTNCVIHDTHLAGIAVEMVDGGGCARVNFSDIVMRRVGCGIFVRLGDRARPWGKKAPKPGMGTMRDVAIRNVLAVDVGKTGCAVTGLPGFPVENLVMAGIRMTFEGGGTRADAARRLPEKPAAYPEYGMFGTLPAYGFFFRHVRGLLLKDVVLDFASREERPPLAFLDVSGLEVRDFRGETSSSTPALVLVERVRNARMECGWTGKEPAKKVELQGNENQSVTFRCVPWTGGSSK